MTGWPASELDTIGNADELHITTRRPDGSLRPWVPIWVVRVDDALYIRSYRGTDAAWYRHATNDRSGLIRVAGLQREVAFESAPEGTAGAIGAAYSDKYADYGPRYLQPMVTGTARATTLRVTPHRQSTAPTITEGELS
jgi:hypothetical protein